MVNRRETLCLGWEVKAPDVGAIAPDIGRTPWMLLGRQPSVSGTASAQNLVLIFLKSTEKFYCPRATRPTVQALGRSVRGHCAVLSTIHLRKLCVQSGAVI